MSSSASCQDHHSSASEEASALHLCLAECPGSERRLVPEYDVLIIGAEGNRPCDFSESVRDLPPSTCLPLTFSLILVATQIRLDNSLIILFEQTLINQNSCPEILCQHCLEINDRPLKNRDQGVNQGAQAWGKLNRAVMSSERLMGLPKISPFLLSPFPFHHPPS